MEAYRGAQNSSKPQDPRKKCEIILHDENIFEGKYFFTEIPVNNRDKFSFGERSFGETSWNSSVNLGRPEKHIRHHLGDGALLVKVQISA